MTTVSVPGNAAEITARAATADFDVTMINADSVTLLLPATASSDEIQTIGSQLVYVFGPISADDPGWLTVTARGILGMADTADTGGAPDYVPVMGQVTLTPGLQKPIRNLVSGEFLAIAPIVATFDSDGELSYDSVKNVRIIAPLWASLSNQTWKWTADVRPGAGQSWAAFTVIFSGVPGATINLASLLT